MPMTEVETFGPEDDGSDDAMAIDEEGRPRFAPAKDIVSRIGLPITRKLV
jgi:hypothetical protein